MTRRDRARAPRTLETALLGSVLAGVIGVLLTPFVVTPDTLYPFVVGKALWSRCVIAVTVALWAALATMNPDYRPRRSWVFAALLAAFAAAVLAAAFGVGLQRSLWSTYDRMQGVIDLAHWLGFAVVLAATLRTARAWRALLALEVGIAAAMACIVLARKLGIDVPFFGLFPEKGERPGGPLGNPNYLAHYLLINLALALAFLARWAAHSPEENTTRRRNWPLGALWAGCAALLAAGLSLAGSMGALVGLGAGAAFVAAAFAWFATTPRARWGAIAVLLVLGGAAFGAGTYFFAPERAPAVQAENPLLARAANAHFKNPTFQSRLAAWQAGAEGFAARPVLGWGPGNFETVFGRFASGYGATVTPHDSAHAVAVEVAATTGAVGLITYLALWFAAFAALWQAAARRRGGERAFVLFLAAALVAGFAWSQSQFDTATSSLLHTLLFAFAMHAESSARRGAPAGTTQARVAIRRRAAWAVLATTAGALAVAGLAAHRAVWTAADFDLARGGPAGLVRGIDAFDPLANTYRRGLIHTVGSAWAELRRNAPTAAFALLDEAHGQASVALRTEPYNWRTAHALARMYDAVATTEPEYRDRAKQHLARARALAPNRPVFPAPLSPPQPLAIRRAGDGSVELHWRGSAGAGYHQLAERQGERRRRKLADIYDAHRMSFTVPPRAGLQPARYRIRACLHPKNCTAWAHWPEVSGLGGPDPR